MHSPPSLLAELTARGVHFTLHHHAPVHTVADGAGLFDHLPGAHIKNLFVKDKAGQLYVITVLQERRLDLVKLGKSLGSKDRLSFASPDKLMEVLGVEPGSVSPLGLVNARPGALRFVLDAAILDAPWVYPHPLINTQTVQMHPTDLLACTAAWGHVAEVIDVAPCLRP